MGRWKKWLLGLTGVGALGMVGLAATLRYTAACGPAPAVTGSTMQAVTYRCYGPAEVLQLETVAKPTPAADEVLVRIEAASVNPLDMHQMHGTPYVLRLAAGIGAPSSAAFGTDFAGVIEAVGADVTRFKPGDAVFGAGNGAFAEYLVRRADGAIALKPAALSFEQAAALPVAAVTALQALRDKAQVQAGHKVLINGASGGVGSFAVQIAKALGAEVAGVSSTRNLELVRALGADRVIDYTAEDFTQAAERYDAIIDMVGNHSVATLAQVLKPQGVLVVVGAVEKNNWLEPFSTMAKVAWGSAMHEQRIEFLLASIDGAALDTLAAMADAGQLRASIERSYLLSEAREAMRHLETGRTRGKIVIDLVP
jgi:NADPH:quinone reductase-like Zn-dependent oxidoreductase